MAWELHTAQARPGTAAVTAEGLQADPRREQ